MPTIFLNNTTEFTKLTTLQQGTEQLQRNYKRVKRILEMDTES